MSPDRSRVLAEGLVAGFVGYAAVAVFFGLVNLFAGRPLLYTAALLGQALTGGSAGSEAVVVEAAPVLAYNAVHLLIFLAVGVLISLLVGATERNPNVWTLFFLIFVGLVMVTTMAFAILARPLSARLPWWSLAGANLSAALAMGAYLVYRHPALLADVRAAET